jgi:hypothetical protein
MGEREPGAPGKLAVTLAVPPCQLIEDQRHSSLPVFGFIPSLAVGDPADAAIILSLKYLKAQQPNSFMGRL